MLRPRGDPGAPSRPAQQRSWNPEWRPLRPCVTSPTPLDPGSSLERAHACTTLGRLHQPGMLPPPPFSLEGHLLPPELCLSLPTPPTACLCSQSLSHPAWDHVFTGAHVYFLSTPLRGTGVKNPPANAGDEGLIPGSGRFPGGGNGNRLQYSCLENIMDRGAQRPGYSPWGHKGSDATE